MRAAGVPLFQTIETYKPRPAALLHGGLLAILSILAAVALIGKAGGVARPFLIGMHFSRPGLLPVDRNSLAASGLNTTVKLGTGPLRGVAEARPALFRFRCPCCARSTPIAIFRSHRGRSVTPRRRFAIWTPAAEGKLTAEECGLQIDPNSVPPAMLAQLRRQFMNYHPVLAALDSDHDGELSAWEIDHAAAALKKLDRNHDGYLTADELIPFEMAVRAGLR